MHFTFTATLWQYSGDKATWFFVTVPNDVADDIEYLSHGRTGGFGSVRVEVRIGGSRWATSLFPDSKAATYILPVKKAVRLAEGVADGDQVDVELRLEGSEA